MLSDQEKLKEQKVNEWERGLRPDNKKIGEYRDPEYKAFKQQFNPLAGGYVDLLLTRQTSKTLFVRPYAGGFIFNMNDTHNLVGRYGFDILGLNQKWFDERQKNIYKQILSFKIGKILNKR